MYFTWTGKDQLKTDFLEIISGGCVKHSRHSDEDLYFRRNLGVSGKNHFLMEESSALGFGRNNENMDSEEPQSSININRTGLKPPYFLAMGARNEEAVKVMAGNLKKYVLEHPADSAAVCYTLSDLQKERYFKAAARIDNSTELLRVLESIQNGETHKSIYKGSSDPNRETPVYIMMSGRRVLDLKAVNIMGDRFRIFKEAIGQCIDACEKNGILCQVLDDNIMSFSVCYASGVLLKHFEIIPQGILAEGTGVIAAMALTGLITLEKAIALVAKKETGNLCSGEKVHVFKDCNVITYKGIVKEESLEEYFHCRRIDNESRDRLAWIMRHVQKDHCVLFINGNYGNLEVWELQDKYCLFENNLKAGSPVESVVDLFARLYVSGVKLNPVKFYGESVNKVFLPI